MRPAVSSLDEARASGAKRYRTGKPCLRGHIAERLTSTQGCVECYALARQRFNDRAFSHDAGTDEAPPHEVADILRAMAARRMTPLDSLAERVGLPLARVEALLEPHRDKHWRIAAHIVGADGRARIVAQVGAGPSAERAASAVRGVRSVFELTFPCAA